VFVLDVVALQEVSSSSKECRSQACNLVHPAGQPGWCELLCVTERQDACV
jgi:hypothetical protein